jgi:predicted aldo/keto reductase-like oxidoreductase
MDGNYLVNVEISSKVKHHMLESHARPVRGNLRQTTRKLFEHGQKPYKHCLKKFQDTPTDVKIAGNFSNFGNTTRKFQQIASESRYQNRLDPEEFERLNQNRTKDVECNEEIRLETGIAGCPLTGFEHANS